MTKQVWAALALSGVALTGSVAVAQRQYADWDWDGSVERLTKVNAGTYVEVQTTQPIESDRSDGRVFTGVVAEDVWDDYRRLAVPAIPRGSRVELTVRSARDGDLILDLESIFAHGQRYAVSAVPERVENDDRHPRGDDAAAFVGGGAIIGTIIGSIAGGGKGAAIGAGAGAATGLGLLYRGHDVRVPSGSLLTFRIDEPLFMGVQDHGYNRGRQHFHRGPDGPPPFQRR